MRRLPAEHDRGHAFVLWNMTMADRRTGWLTPSFHAAFREVLLHTLARHRLIGLAYCLTIHYLRENSVRAGLTTQAADWPFSGAVAVGYPRLDWRSEDFTERLWRIYDVVWNLRLVRGVLQDS